MSLGVFRGLGDRSLAQKTNDNTIKKSKHVYTNMKTQLTFPHTHNNTETIKSYLIILKNYLKKLS